jgi:LmbE family N-acetylglucosaminyl deacetylase
MSAPADFDPNAPKPGAPGTPDFHPNAPKPGAPGTPGLLGRTLVLVAHPDDESAGCGALLQRMREPIVVVATDGAPGDRYFWGSYGSRLHYASLRREEASAALASAGINEIVFLAGASGAGEKFVDQELYCALGEVVSELSAVVNRYRPETVLTMAYEGGHPDHDVCSFLGAVLGRQYGLPVWEFPLYHRLASGPMIWQRFLLPSDDEETVLQVAPAEAEIKRRMLSAYVSQGSFLAQFGLAIERFRPQPTYDYSEPPHPGKLNYETWQWPMTGRDICTAFSGYLRTERRRAG